MSTEIPTHHFLVIATRYTFYESERLQSRGIRNRLASGVDRASSLQIANVA